MNTNKNICKEITYRTVGGFCLFGLVFQFEGGRYLDGTGPHWMMEVFVSILDFVVDSGFIDAYLII